MQATSFINKSHNPLLLAVLQRRPDIAARFWLKVNCAGECWLFPTKTPGDYGSFWLTSGRGSLPAHRVAFILANGAIPDDALICHKCDNPNCVRPSHLFVGSYRDNSKDALVKGRWMPIGFTGHVPLKGVDNPTTKLTPDIISDIRANQDRFSHRELAFLFGISKSHVGRIIRGETWR